MRQEKRYKVEKVNEGKYLAISKDYAGLDDFLPELSEELKNKKVKGEIILDLLLANGNNSSRFYKIAFNGEQFEFGTLKQIPAPEQNVINKINNFLKKNPSILNNGVLSKAEVTRVLSTINLKAEFNPLFCS